MLKKYHKISNDPFDLLRSLRNKIVHVINPLRSIGTFMYTNQNTKLSTFLKDFSLNSGKIITSFEEQTKKIKEMEEQARMDSQALQNNVYKLKL